MIENQELFKKQTSEFKPLLELNDALRVCLQNIDNINVATMIVVGDQSHGKTSVIERLSGLQLPRGQGIQTRAPTEIRLKSCPTS
jgi:GTP1/Obg family GTP-binding protein